MIPIRLVIVTLQAPQEWFLIWFAEEKMVVGFLRQTFN